jgi:hypothetical protein
MGKQNPKWNGYENHISTKKSFAMMIMFECHANNDCLFNCVYMDQIYAYVRGYIQKFPDWPPGARTANGTALCH